jgi:hypothetical protein
MIVFFIFTACTVLNVENIVNQWSGENNSIGFWLFDSSSENNQWNLSVLGILSIVMMLLLVGGILTFTMLNRKNAVNNRKYLHCYTLGGIIIIFWILCFSAGLFTGNLGDSSYDFNGRTYTWILSGGKLNLTGGGVFMVVFAILVGLYCLPAFFLTHKFLIKLNNRLLINTLWILVILCVVMIYISCFNFSPQKITYNLTGTEGSTVFFHTGLYTTGIWKSGGGTWVYEVYHRY